MKEWNKPTQAEWKGLLPGGQMEGGEYHLDCPLCGGNNNHRFWVGPTGTFGCRQCGDQPDFYRRALDAIGWQRGSKGKGMWPSSDPMPAGAGDYYETQGPAGAWEHYVYRDGAGAAAGEVFRHRTDKLIRPRYWSGTGWTNKIGTIGALLWRGAKARAAAEAGLPIHILEGERKTRDLALKGEQAGAICSCGGSSRAFNRGHAKMLPSGGPVFIWIDNDQPGHKWAGKVARALVSAGHKAEDVGLVLPEHMGYDPERPDGMDVGDWLMTSGRGRKEVEELMDSAIPWSDMKDDPRFEAEPVATVDGGGKRKERAAPDPSAQDLDPMDDYSLAVEAIRLYQGRLAITPLGDPAADQEILAGRPYILEEDGVWSASGSLWGVVMSDVSDAVNAQVRSHHASYEDEAAFARALIRSRALRSITRARALQRNLYATYRRLARNKDPLAAGVRLVEESEWDTSGALGARNGVVDLETASLLPPDQAADRLITTRAPHPYRPGLVDERVERLLAHVPDGPYLLQQCGWWLRYGPGRRVVVVVGPPNSGKSAVLNAIHNALGKLYATAPGSQSFDRPRNQPSADGPRPALMKFCPPARLAMMVEASREPKDVELIKQVSGSDHITARNLYSNDVTFSPQAGFLMVTNDDAIPKFGLEEPAVRDRIVVVPFPEVPKEQRSASFINTVSRDRLVGEAMLSLLVRHAAACVLDSPPDVPERVVLATDEVAADDVGELGQFVVEEVVQDPDGKLLSADLWDAWVRWCLGDGEAPKGDKVGGQLRSTFTSAVRRHLHGKPPTKRIWVDGVRGRGWEGWRLATLDDEPVVNPIERAGLNGSQHAAEVPQVQYDSEDGLPSWPD